ncbi:MAG: DUF1028 domain-containing protein [Halanaerobiales bacterium]
MSKGQKEIIATFSIVGFDPETGELGIAVQSKFLAVGALVPWAKAGVGAIATQSLANISYGPEGLELMAQGKNPDEVVEILTAKDEDKDYRQIGVVDVKGNSATFTGDKCYDWAGGVAGENFAAQGNILVSEDTVNAMADTFQKSEGRLADRLLKSLAAGQEAGGDSRGRQSAALLVVKEKGGYGGYNDRYIDLRVDDHPTPIKELGRLLDIFYLYFSDEEADIVKIEGSVTEKVKESLSNMGIYDGEINEEFDKRLKQAINTFYHRENFEEREVEEGYIYEDILNYLLDKSKKG